MSPKWKRQTAMFAFVMIAMTTLAMKNHENNDPKDLENEMRPMHSNSPTTYNGPRQRNPYDQNDEDLALETAQILNADATRGDWELANELGNVDGDHSNANDADFITATFNDPNDQNLTNLFVRDDYDKVPMEEWTVSQVVRWAKENYLKELVDIVQQNEITGEKLVKDLDEKSLLYFGLGIFRINTILRKISEMRNSQRLNKDPEKYSKNIGVYYDEPESRWVAERRSKKTNILCRNGYHENETKAAHASDALARQLMADEAEDYELNFPTESSDEICCFCYDHMDPKSKEIFITDCNHRYHKSCMKLWKKYGHKKCPMCRNLLKKKKDERRAPVINPMLNFEKRLVEDTAALASETLARKLMADRRESYKFNFPNENLEKHPHQSDRAHHPNVLNDNNNEVIEIHRSESSEYIGVRYNKKEGQWHAQRLSTNEHKIVHNGCYKYEEDAAHASDTLARKLMANGEQNHRLNFPDNNTEVYPKKKNLSKYWYFGVKYCKKYSNWCVERYSKNLNKKVYNGRYKDEKAAAHASDTLARKLIANGENDHKLNFPDNDCEVYRDVRISEYFGVSYDASKRRWRATRWSKNGNKTVSNGSYKDEETAAHASDTLARKLRANGERNVKLNFPDDDCEVYTHEQEPNHNQLNFPDNNNNGVIEEHSGHEEIQNDAACFDEATGIWRVSRIINGRHVYAFFASLEDANRVYAVEDANAAPDKFAHKYEMKTEKSHPQKLNFPQQKKSPENKKCKKCGKVNFTDGEMCDKCDGRKRKRSDNEFED